MFHWLFLVAISDSISAHVGLSVGRSICLSVGLSVGHQFVNRLRICIKMMQIDFRGLTDMVGVDAHLRACL
jgi:predicted sugar kinase